MHRTSIVHLFAPLRHLESFLLALAGNILATDANRRLHDLIEHASEWRLVAVRLLRGLSP
jgi:hypothetical protein